AYGEGCTECRGTGYKGRTGIFEVMDFSDRVRTVLSGSVVDMEALYKAAKQDGMITLRECAVKKMLEGITTYEEVVAITG
ncbi:MAG: type II/IV secretion system protein, partial [Deltaproteobacteria bacterium]